MAADVPLLPADAVYTSTFRYKNVLAWLTEQFSEAGYREHFALHAAKRFDSRGNRCVPGPGWVQDLLLLHKVAVTLACFRHEQLHSHS